MNDSGGPTLVSFQQTSAKQVLEKLRREIARVDSSLGDPARDHVANAFWTAWHMHEWVWNAIRQDANLKNAVLKYRGMDDEIIDTSTSFGEALARRFVPLKICRLVALSPSQVEIVFAPEEDIVPLPAMTNAHDPDHAESRPATPALLIMGRSVHAARLLREIEEYWVTLIQDCGIEHLA